MDKEKAIDKIRKCLALSKSANEHESAAALRQAQALMKKYGMTVEEAGVSDIQELGSRASAKSKPSQWENNLACTMGQIFGCNVIFGYQEWFFVGYAPGPEIAQYAFTVLLRQLKKARKVFLGDYWSCRRQDKTSMGDAFCLGWIDAATRKILPWAVSSEQRKGIQGYMDQKYGELEDTKIIERIKKYDKALAGAFGKGYAAGEDAQIYRGVDPNAPREIGVQEGAL